MPEMTPAPQLSPAVTMTPAPSPTPLGPFVTALKGISINMTRDQVKEVLGSPSVSDKTGVLYEFSKTHSAQIGLDSKGKVRTIALIYMDGDTGPMSYTDVFGPDAVPVPKKSGNIYKLVRYPADHFWISYSMTNPGSKPMTVVTMRRIGN